MPLLQVRRQSVMPKTEVLFLLLRLFLQVEEKCRAWNETRCPSGIIKVDYTDPSRMESVQFKSNVKTIDPNTTIIYACKSTILQESSTTFIGPETLDVNPGDVLSSAQSGGIIHKIRSTSNEGNNQSEKFKN